MSSLKSGWKKGYGEGLGLGLIAAPIWIPIAEGRGLSWPRLEDIWTYGLCIVGGIALLWWARRIKS